MKWQSHQFHMCNGSTQLVHHWEPKQWDAWEYALAKGKWWSDDHLRTMDQESLMNALSAVDIKSFKTYYNHSHSMFDHWLRTKLFGSMHYQMLDNDRMPCSRDESHLHITVSILKRRVLSMIGIKGLKCRYSIFSLAFPCWTRSLSQKISKRPKNKSISLLAEW